MQSIVVFNLTAFSAVSWEADVQPRGVPMLLVEALRQPLTRSAYGVITGGTTQLTVGSVDTYEVGFRGLGMRWITIRRFVILLLPIQDLNVGLILKTYN